MQVLSKYILIDNLNDAYSRQMIFKIVYILASILHITAMYIAFLLKITECVWSVGKILLTILLWNKFQIRWPVDFSIIALEYLDTTTWHE